MTDQEIINGIRAKDRTAELAFEEIFSGPLYNRFRLLLGADKVRDLIQETCVRVYKAIVAGNFEFRFEGCLERYVFAVANNLYHKMPLRKELQHHPIDSAEHRLPAENPEPQLFTFIMSKEFEDKFRECIGRLPLKHRVIFLMYYPLYFDPGTLLTTAVAEFKNISIGGHHVLVINDIVRQLPTEQIREFWDISDEDLQEMEGDYRELVATLREFESAKMEKTGTKFKHCGVHQIAKILDMAYQEAKQSLEYAQKLMRNCTKGLRLALTTEG